MRPILAPCPQQLVRSTGALVWRFTGPERVIVPDESTDPVDIEVLMIHQPHYHDWFWPRGKTEHGKPLVTVAVREVEEETGQIIAPGAPLTTQRYRLDDGQAKEVHYWVGTPVPAGHVSKHLRAPAARALCTEIDQTAQTSSGRAVDTLARRGDRRLLTDVVARAREGRLATATLLILRPGQGPTPRLDEARDAHAAASPSASSGGFAASAEATAPSKPHPAPTPAMVALITVRRATQVEQDPAKRVKTAPESVNPPLSRFGVRQVFSLIDLLSSSGVTRTFALPAARSRQGLTPWASMDGGSVTLVESLDLTISGPDAQIDGKVRPGRVRAFAVERPRKRASPTVLSAVGTTHDVTIEKIRACASAPVAGGEAPCLRHGQVLVTHVEYAGDSLTVAVLETHGVTTEDPVAHTRKVSRRH